MISCPTRAGYSLGLCVLLLLVTSSVDGENDQASLESEHVHPTGKTALCEYEKSFEGLPPEIVPVAWRSGPHTMCPGKPRQKAGSAFEAHSELIQIATEMYDGTGSSRGHMDASP